MKKILFICIALALLASFTACTTVNGVRQPDIARIALVTREAASIGTQEALLVHPEWLPYFAIAHAELRTLATSETISVTDILGIIGRLPVKELKSQAARVSIEGAQLLIVASGFSEVNAERVAQLKPIVEALYLGMEAGGVPQ